MKIAITGSSGLVGSSLIYALKIQGWEILALNRKDLSLDEKSLAMMLDGYNVVVNLAGAPIIKRWTPTYKEIIYSSRIHTTDKLVSALRLCTHPPSLLISSSAVGIYPSVGGPFAEGDSEISMGFLGKLASEWEKAALNYQDLGRVVILRFGIILSNKGGALLKLLPLFRLGLGGAIGNGRQAFSWIHIGDIIKIIQFAITESTIKGVVNSVAPELTTNMGFTKKLALKLHRPALIPVPEFGLKMLFGEGASVLTEGQLVMPERLLRAGFNFHFPDLEGALDDILKGE
ncbi:MAG: TIGR01777 family oxidoreductase [Bacteroidota bacterium]